MISLNGLHILLTLIFGKTQKFIWMAMWWTTKEKKTSEGNYLAFLKVVPGTFWVRVQKQKTNLDFQRIW